MPSLLTRGALVLTLAACGSADDLRFAEDVWPILQERCVRCHATSAGQMTPNMGEQASGLGIGASDPAFAYDALIDKHATFAPELVYVEPGSSATSYLYHKVAGTQASVGGIGGTMPPSSMLTAEELATIRDWIDAGARE